MRTAVTALAALALLTACTSEADLAEREFRMVEKTGISQQDSCDAARKVKAAYLKAGNADKHSLWSIVEAGECPPRSTR